MARGEAGSSLVEVLIAALVVTSGVVTMAQLFSVATATNLTARRGTVAAILAQQKVEQLCALTFGYDAAGVPSTDTATDTTRTPPATGGTGLQLSPLAALQQNTAGFVDHLGGDGRVVGSGAQRPAEAVFTRRWSVEPVPASPDNALLIQVLVTTPSREAGATDEGTSPPHGGARVVTVRTRK